MAPNHSVFWADRVNSPARAEKGAALACLCMLCACAQAPVVRTPGITAPSEIRLELLEDRVSAWHRHRAPGAARGLRLVFDAPMPVGFPALAATRSILRANPRLHPVDALLSASSAVSAAEKNGLPYGFFCAVLLQESAFDPDAVSSAGAIGIAQFTLGTARAHGVDPFDPRDAIRGSARLLAGYVRAYTGAYADPYASALAAYNAGPGAVAYYHGVPPYRETKEYISDIYDRWSRILRDASKSERSRALYHRLA
jgi:Transglycosylase SLT domain